MKGKVIDMRKPNIEFLKRVKRERIVDTKKYRYYCENDYDGRIMRVPIEYLNTTAVLDFTNHEFVCHESEVK